MGLIMGGLFYRSGESSGFQYGKRINNSSEDVSENKANNKVQEKDNDLIIEDNTIYEIDRDCYERLKKQKKGTKIYPTGSK